MTKPVVRSRRGVLASIVLDNGKVRLSVDDLVKVNGSTWRHDGLVSEKEYDEHVFDGLEFSEQELAEFGYYILARLYAYYKRNEI